MKIISDISILKAKNERVEPDEVDNLVKILEEALSDSIVPGVGLAAPQVGINKSLAIVRVKQGNKLIESINLVNPVILEKQCGFLNKDEGCLSIPGKRFNTHRFNELFVKDDLHPAGFVTKGLVSVVIQHEVDHLDGILVSDRAVGKNKIGRNDPCPCGKMKNGKPIKFKKCHGK